MADRRHYRAVLWRGLRLTLGALLCCALPLQAGEFKELSIGQQRILQPYAKEWDNFSPEKQERLQKGADRWLTMSPEQRQGIRERFEQFQSWQSLGPEQRARFKQRFS
jgi:hypothetical protein